MKVVDIFQRVESECERVLESEREREREEVGGEQGHVSSVRADQQCGSASVRLRQSCVTTTRTLLCAHIHIHLEIHRRGNVKTNPGECNLRGG